MSKVEIRKARREDMKDVCDLIKELASFQKLEDQMQLNAKTLENDAFSIANPAFHCYVAEFDQKIIGYLIYYYCYSTFLGKSVFCEDLYVQPHMRKRGIGKRLMAELAKIALENACRLDFHVLRWNPAIKFYEELGAINLSETEKWSLFRLEKDSLEELVK